MVLPAACRSEDHMWGMPPPVTHQKSVRDDMRGHLKCRILLDIAYNQGRKKDEKRPAGKVVNYFLWIQALQIVPNGQWKVPGPRNRAEKASNFAPQALKRIATCKIILALRGYGDALECAMGPVSATQLPSQWFSRGSGVAWGQPTLL